MLRFLSILLFIHTFFCKCFAASIFVSNEISRHTDGNNWSPLTTADLDKINDEHANDFITKLSNEDINSLLAKSQTNSFEISHILSLKDANSYDEVLNEIDLSHFPLNSFQVQTTIVNKILWPSRYGHLGNWPIENFKFFQDFFIRGFTVSTLQKLNVNDKSPKNIIAFITEPNSKSIISPEVCRYVFFIERKYNYHTRNYRKPLTGRVQNCLNNEYLLTAQSVKSELIKDVDLSWYQFHLIMMTQPKITAGDSNLIKYFSINDFEISIKILREVISTESKSLIEIQSPLAREFVYQTILYEYGNEFYHYSDSQIRVILNFLDNMSLKELKTFRNIHINPAISSEELEVKETYSVAKKQILLQMYKTGRFSNVKISSEDIQKLKWISHALKLSEIKEAAVETLREILDQFMRYNQNTPNVSMFMVIENLMNKDPDNIAKLEQFKNDPIFGFWVSEVLKLSSKQGFLNNLASTETLTEISAHERCSEVSINEMGTVQAKDKLAVLSALSWCKPDRGRSQWILSEVRSAIHSQYGLDIVDFSRLPDYFEAAFSGEIWRELKAEELETLPQSLCFDLFSRISGSSMQTVPAKMGRKLVEVYMSSCAKRQYLSRLDLNILGPMVCYIAPSILESSNRQVINDNLHLFYNCCLPDSTAKVIRGHVLKDSVFSRSIIRSLGPSYHSIIDGKLIDQLKNMSTFLMDYILADLSTIVNQGKPPQCDESELLENNFKLLTEMVKEKLIKSTKMMKGCNDRRPEGLTCPIIKELGSGKHEELDLIEVIFIRLTLLNIKCEIINLCFQLDSEITSKSGNQ